MGGGGESNAARAKDKSDLYQEGEGRGGGESNAARAKDKRP